MNYELIFSPPQSSDLNMNRDVELLHNLDTTENPILHFYNWEKEAATFGHFIEPEKIFNRDVLINKTLDISRRPTGGGVVFHNCDLAFSFLLPATHPSFSHRPLENYAFVNQKVGEAISRFLGKKLDLLQEESHFPSTMDRFCMAKPTKYDVMLRGKKVGGAAQRKTRSGYLHQGSIFIGLLTENYLKSVLVDGEQVYREMRRNSLSLLGDDWTTEDLISARITLQTYLTQVFLQ